MRRSPALQTFSRRSLPGQAVVEYAGMIVMSTLVMSGLLNGAQQIMPVLFNTLSQQNARALSDAPPAPRVGLRAPAPDLDLPQPGDWFSRLKSGESAGESQSPSPHQAQPRLIAETPQLENRETMQMGISQYHMGDPSSIPAEKSNSSPGMTTNTVPRVVEAPAPAPAPSVYSGPSPAPEPALASPPKIAPPPMSAPTPAPVSVSPAAL